MTFGVARSVGGVILVVALALVAVLVLANLREDNTKDQHLQDVGRQVGAGACALIAEDLCH